MKTEHLSELLAKATPLPWVVEAEGEQEYFAPFVGIGPLNLDPILGMEVAKVALVFGESADEPDAALIVAAVNALPELLAQSKEIEHLREALRDVKAEWIAPCEQWDRTNCGRCRQCKVALRVDALLGAKP